MSKRSTNHNKPDVVRTKFDVLVARAKDNWFVAAVIALTSIVITLGALTDAVSKVGPLVGRVLSRTATLSTEISVRNKTSQELVIYDFADAVVGHVLNNSLSSIAGRARAHLKCIDGDGSARDYRIQPQQMRKFRAIFPANSTLSALYAEGGSDLCFHVFAKSVNENRMMCLPFQEQSLTTNQLVPLDFCVPECAQ
jgi:hypothetical protein